MAHTGASVDLAQRVTQWALDRDAALMDIASIARFDPMAPYYDRAPRAHDPRDFAPGARSVIPIVQPVLGAVMDAPAVRDYRSVARIDKDVIFYDTPSRSYPARCNARTTRIPNTAVRGGCARICPLPTERTNLPERQQQIGAEWKGSDGTGR